MSRDRKNPATGRSPGKNEPPALPISGNPIKERDGIRQALLLCSVARKAQVYAVRKSGHTFIFKTKTSLYALTSDCTTPTTKRTDGKEIVENTLPPSH